MTVVFVASRILDQQRVCPCTYCGRHNDCSHHDDPQQSVLDPHCPGVLRHGHGLVHRRVLRLCRLRTHRVCAVNYLATLHTNREKRKLAALEAAAAGSDEDLTSVESAPHCRVPY
ncbi:hypothetical protein SKAU_G00239250 [Synaphobranchus kaupii]|uniref:Uncharacterized protein n=1 Tax=Synaphobranchus kaupii TaxID=118154 RepID=A0A9Q1IU25_SYNKA|nr:hypothetical protein SKAU_G00239250 [Synaphobranchus kaupii]